MHNQNNVRSAWENFMSDSRANLPVRPVVLESWKRSRHFQAPVTTPATKTPPTENLRQSSHTHALLQRIADPVLTQAQRWLSDAHCMLMLTDAQGFVLRVSGDSRTIAMGQEIGLQQGHFWRERDVGTNAIGTALAMNAPVRIHAFEHFCQQVQRWSCAASPVRDPRNGSLLGVVDISSPAAFASNQTMAHASLLAHHIHGLLAQQYQQQHVHILQCVLERQSHWQDRQLLALDRYGRILHPTVQQALRDTPLQDKLDTHGDLGQLLSHLPPDQWHQTLNALVPGLDVDIIQSANQEPIGAVLILPKTRNGRGTQSRSHLKKQLLPQAQFRSEVPSTTSANPENYPQRQQRQAIDVSQSQPLPEIFRLQDTSNPAPRIHKTTDIPAAFRSIVGNSAKLRQTLAQAAQIARSGLPVLLEGETGTGKELFAQAIHASSRADKPFVPVNCGGLPQDLIGSEIFGYERGAFTGALQTGHAGKLEAADGGTFCLDEIGEMPSGLQPYLLRVLEDRQVFRIGSNTPRQVDVRIIAMTNRDLGQEIREGRFRQDLFYRIAVTHLRIPPLRERSEDIPELVRHFALQAATRAGREPSVFSAEAMELLQQYPWPGNIRQLRNCVETLVLLNTLGWIDAEHLPADILDTSAFQPTPDNALPRADDQGTCNLHKLEQDTILRAIKECQGNLSAAAKRLGIARSTLYSRLGRLH